MDIISQFANPETMLQMSTSQKLIAGLIVTALGMGVTVSALIILSWISRLMSLVVRGTEKKESMIRGTRSKSHPVAEAIKVIEAEKVMEPDDEELIAVITAAIAATMGKSTSDIVVTNIRRTGDATPVWGQMGRQQQMINRF